MSTSTNPVLSIIVPMHRTNNKFEQLRNWMSSINDSNSLEVILIYDYFDKSTLKIVKTIQKEFRKFSKLVLVNYQSPGLTRNAGIAEATGKWIMFWDSDDMGDPSLVLQELQNTNLNSTNVIFQYQSINALDGTVIARRQDRNLNDVAMNPGIWRIAIWREFMHNQYFQDIKMGEDQVFLLQIKLFQSNPVINNKIVYWYHINVEHQLTQSNEARRDIKKALEASLYDLFENSSRKKAKQEYIILIRILLTFCKSEQLFQIIKFLAYKREIIFKIDIASWFKLISCLFLVLRNMK